MFLKSVIMWKNIENFSKTKTHLLITEGIVEKNNHRYCTEHGIKFMGITGKMPMILKDMKISTIIIVNYLWIISIYIFFKKIFTEHILPLYQEKRYSPTQVQLRKVSKHTYVENVRLI